MAAVGRVRDADTGWRSPMARRIDRNGPAVARVMCRRSLCGRGQWKPPITPVDTLIAGT
jgi:hypothetical protein